MEYINTMIQTEAQDYAMSLVLAAYLKYREPSVPESRAFLKKAFIFISKEEILARNPFKDSSEDSHKTDFGKFIAEASHGLVLDPQRSVGEIVEDYRGFHLVWFNDFYFGWKKGTGDFNLGKFRWAQGLDHLVSRRKHELRALIDQVWANADPRSLDQGNDLSQEIVYKNFRISKINDVYFCLSTNEGQRTLFTSRSLPEAQLVIDHFLKM